MLHELNLTIIESEVRNGQLVLIGDYDITVNFNHTRSYESTGTLAVVIDEKPIHTDFLTKT
jgi:hypothetical protein